MFANPHSILVSGCGGDIAQGIARLLRSALPVHTMILGSDIHLDHAGGLIFDDCILLPPGDGGSYVELLTKALKRRKVDAFIPVTESEIRCLVRVGATNGIDRTRFVLPSLSALQVGLDKFATAEFLKSQGLPHPWTSLVHDGPPDRLPCIAKDRWGHGGRQVHRVEAGDVTYIRARFPNYIWQELLGSDDDEYTCGIYRCRTDGSTRTIAIRRRLSGGFTTAGTVVVIREIERLLQDVAYQLDLVGSINVQLRMRDNTPVIFEINPRFSSTTCFRHLLGFQDVIWALQETFGARADEYRPARDGSRIYRGSVEFIVQ